MKGVTDIFLNPFKVENKCRTDFSRDSWIHESRFPSVAFSFRRRPRARHVGGQKKPYTLCLRPEGREEIYVPHGLIIFSVVQI